MKNIAIVLFILLSNSIYAQHNRHDVKSCVPYRANYMRATTGSVSSHNIEIRKGNIWTWGLNNNGQLGDGTLINKTNAVQVGNDNTWVLVTTGNSHSLGIKANGTLWAWGLNTDGQLGDGTYVNKNIPVQIGTDSNWISIKAGTNFSIGIKGNGTLWTWGLNNWGQLGTGTSIQKSNVPIQIGTEQIWTSIACGSNHSIALKANGTLWAWGKNDFGQLGDSSLVNKNLPVLISSDSNWTKISAGAFHNLALKANGTLWAWGNNTNGELGDSSVIQKNYPTKVGNERNWIAISAGGNHSMAIKVFGTLYSWGKNNNGQLGIGNNSITNQNFPVKIGAKNNWVFASAGNNFTMALGADGKLFSFGSNGFGELGNGNLLNQNIPILKSLPANEWLIVYGGKSISMGIKTNGTLWAWGSNTYSQLGMGLSFNSSLNFPHQIGNDSNWTAVWVGKNVVDNNVFGLKANGTIWTWGNNGYIENNTTIVYLNSPALQNNDSNWAFVSFIRSIKADGTLWEMIYDTNNIYKLVKIDTDSNWVCVSYAYYNIIYGLKANGTIWSKGTPNSLGGLGNGTFINGNNTFGKIGNSNDWCSVNGVNSFGAAIKSNGTLWAWGWNDNGQLGDGTTLNKNTPTQIGLQNDWLITSGGGNLDGFSLGLKTNGTLWAWGSNNYGQFGNNSYVGSLVPIKIGANNNWVNISAGTYHSIGLKSYRADFCATGSNGSGELGDSTYDYKAEYNCNQMPFICSPPSSPLVSNKTICENTATNLSSVGIGTLSWYSDSVGGNYLGSGLSYNTPILTNTSNYYVQDSTCAASVRTKVTVFVLAKPKIGFTINNNSQCVNNNSFVFTDTSSISQGNINRLWKISNSDSSTNINFIKTFNSVGNYTIQLSVVNSLNNNCKDSITKAFNIKPKPKVLTSANATVICEGKSITLYGNGAKTYSWSDGVLNGIAFFPLSNKTYIVIGIDSNNCADTANINIIVNKNPSISATASVNPVCAKQPIILTGNGGETYYWSDGITNGVPFVPIVSKTYLLTSLDSKGCSDTSTIYVQILTLPNANITKNKTVITATQIGATYQWLNCNTAKSIIAGAINQIYTATVNGNYAVIVTQNGCSDTSICVNINSVGLSENNNENKISIFPNPANAKLTVTSETAIKEIYIYDLVGKLLNQLDLVNTKTKETEITIDELNAGVYIIQIIDNFDSKYSSKFIKE
jgi:alpha-tubulin suppressor-like RCC1 family protein